jgi:mannitol/fructose-specific phosphotransferase system IIA component (Ntr-type)
MLPLRQSIEQDLVQLDLNVNDIPAIIHAAIELAIKQGKLSREDAQRAEATLQRRESQGATAIGHAVAVPHAYLDCFDEQLILFFRLSRPVNLGAPDGIPTRFVFVLLGPETAVGEHIDALTGVARLMSDDQFRYDAATAQSTERLGLALDAYLQRTSPEVESAGPGEDESLAYTGRLFGGIVQDLRRRWPHYRDDFREGLHFKVVSSTLFLFFACLAPAITFGGVMAIQTDGQIGAVEMILASAICGVVYAIFSGQPLIILGGTGPLLVFTAILFRMCGDLQIPFLPTYVWVGFWSMVLLVAMAITDAGCLMRYFTRFTDEIFSALISVIFIYEAIKSLGHVFEGLDEQGEHATALLSLLLALGTFYIAMALSRFRRSAYLLPQMREFLSDFGPAIAIGAMTLLAVWLHEVDLSVLPAPDSFGTTTGRQWLVDPWDPALPNWVKFAAIGPAVLVAVLVFLDQNITARLVNSPDHQLSKGSAYHLDLALVGLLMGISSLFGLPWLVAATVRSINHVRSLATSEEVVSPGGETRERIIHVRENRITGLGIHLLIGVSLLMLVYLKLIPMAVLYGLFLFMGVVSISGNQFFERLSLWLRDPSLYPSTHYIRRVPLRTIHKFTAVQLVCLGVLWIVKTSALGIVFPLFIAILVPVRFIAGRFFAPEHLVALDAEEEPEEEETHWAA